MLSAVASPLTSPSNDRPPSTPVWWRVSSPDAELRPLSHRQCLQLLGPTGTGQLSFRGTEGTTAAVIDYEIGNTSAVLGPVPVAAVQAMTAHQLVLFQVDRVDLDARWGWTVVMVDQPRSGEYVQVALLSLAGRHISAPHR